MCMIGCSILLTTCLSLFGHLFLMYIVYILWSIPFGLTRCFSLCAANFDDNDEAPPSSGTKQNQGGYEGNDDNLANEMQDYIMF